MTLYVLFGMVVLVLASMPLYIIWDSRKIKSKDIKDPTN